MAGAVAQVASPSGIAAGGGLGAVAAALTLSWRRISPRGRHEAVRRLGHPLTPMMVCDAATCCILNLAFNVL